MDTRYVSLGSLTLTDPPKPRLRRASSVKMRNSPFVEGVKTFTGQESSNNGVCESGEGGSHTKGGITRRPSPGQPRCDWVCNSKSMENLKYLERSPPVDYGSGFVDYGSRCVDYGSRCVEYGSKSPDSQKGARSPSRLYPFGYADYIKQSSDQAREVRGMSTAVRAQDQQALTDALASVRSDTAGVDRKSWVLVGHVNNDPAVIDVVDSDSSPEANFDDFRSRLQDDQVMYGLLRLMTTFDMSSTVKFIYVHWIGENVPFAKKGRFGVVHGSVKEEFSPHHLLIETGNREELILDELMKMVEENAMTRSKVLDVDIKGERQERGFTQHAVRRQDKGTLRSVAPEGATISVDPDLDAAMAEVRNDKSEVTWVLAGYQDGDLKKPLTCLNKGEGSIELMRDHLLDDLVMYGLYRTTDQYDNITTVKFVYVYFIGQNVKPLTKGKVSAYAGPVQKVFSPIHVTLSITDSDDLTEELVNDKVKASSGSKLWEKV